MRSKKTAGFSKVLGVFPVAKDRALVVVFDDEPPRDEDESGVFDDEPPSDEDEHASGVFEELQAAYDDGDYYGVYLVNRDGVVIDSIWGMAGYGSPQKAAKAFWKDSGYA